MRFKHEDRSRLKHVVVERFLWFPLRIKNETRWLEKAKYSGVWYYDFDGWNFLEREWIDDENTDKEMP